MDTPYATIALDTVDSTQDEARARLGDHPNGVLVTAAAQTRGRGRRGHGWINAPRGMAASLAFRPEWPTAAWPRMTLVAGVAAVTAVSEMAGTTVSLKWPNDILDASGGAKLGGILTESSGTVTVAGLGLNLYWPDPPAGIGGLLGADPGPELGGEIAARWADRLLPRVTGDPEAWGADEYRRWCVTLGSEITWEPGGAGLAVDIDEAGRLVVETAAGMVRLVAGEVRQVRPATVAPGKWTAHGGDET
ncbi:MAG: biotin--[acetyl-CoA-carboxylase] ligase [Acidimicrobiia bacterium]